eukprot:6536469-Prymnesium_polylepis.1
MDEAREAQGRDAGWACVQRNVPGGGDGDCDVAGRRAVRILVFGGEAGRSNEAAGTARAGSPGAALGGGG